MLVTYSGRQINYETISKDDIYIHDIFQALPRLNRYVGHSTRTYSVAEHTLMCNKIAKELGYTLRERLLVYIHDFSEAYVGDCPAPLKALLPDFEKYESKVEKAIYNYLDIEPPTEEEYYKIVKVVDLTILAIEMRDLTLHKYQDLNNNLINWDIVRNKKFKLKTRKVSERKIRDRFKREFYNIYSNYMYM